MKKYLHFAKEIETAMNQHQIPLCKRREAVANSIALAVATNAPLPSAPLAGNIKIHYVDNVLPMIQDAIAEVNETVVLDVDLTLEQAYTFWRNRYSLVHEPFAAANFMIDAYIPEDMGKRVRWIMANVLERSEG